MGKRSITGAAIVAAILLTWLPVRPLASAARAAFPQYALTDLGTLGGRIYSPFSPNVGDAGQPYDLNNAGQVVGYSYLADNETSRPFLYQNGSMTQVQVSGGTISTARGNNDLGHIVGQMNVSGTTRNYLLADGATTILPLHPNPLQVRLTPRDVSNAGVVHGSMIYSNGDIHAGIYSNGVFTDLGTFAANDVGDSDTADINESGVVAGWAYNDAGDAHAFVSQSGVMTDLGTLGNGLKSYATGINESGQIVGYGFTDAAGQIDRGFRYDNGQLVTLPLPPPAGFTYTESRALDINDFGTIVGFIRSGSGAARPAIWQEGAVADLTQLVNSSAAGWTLGPGLFINNAGQIVGQGTRPDGHSHMYMLTPVPEPSALTIVALAVGIGVTRRPRRRHRNASLFQCER